MPRCVEASRDAGGFFKLKGIHMNKLLAALIAASFSFGAFASDAPKAVEKKAEAAKPAASAASAKVEAKVEAKAEKKAAH
jgi:hypothetical protein